MDPRKQRRFPPIHNARDLLLPVAGAGQVLWREPVVEGLVKGLRYTKQQVQEATSLFVQVPLENYPAKSCSKLSDCTSIHI